MDVTLVYKGKSESCLLNCNASSTDLFDEVRAKFSLADMNLKVLVKGKQIVEGVPLLETPLKAGAKIMVMATGKRDVSEVQSARSDPTIRSFASEDAAAQHHVQQQRADELSEWAHPQDATYRFCRFEPCTWQSFGTRPQSSTPHAFEARNLMLKLAHDPAIVKIMRERQWTVGLLAELDPVDDRLAEKMESGGKRLLGYNTNAGAQIHIRLRTEDLSGFLAYPAIIDTLLHELTHNEFGPHDEQFWACFCQLKADYLRALLSFSSRGDLFGGRSALQLAHAAEEVRDVRMSVLTALERDRQMPAGQLQIGLLDRYLATSTALEGQPGSGTVLGSVPLAGTSGALPPANAPASSALSASERREQQLRALSARGAASSALSTEAAPASAGGPAGSHPVALKVAPIVDHGNRTALNGEGSEEGAMDVTDDDRS